jgi:hypothetical protein
LENNAFSDHLTLLASDLIKNLDSSKKSRDGFDPIRPLNARENYLRECFFAMGEVRTVIFQLEQSAIFLANFRMTKALKINKISRFDHMIYHMESYIFRVTSVLDRLLILVNRVLNIGLDDKNCKPFRMLVNNKGKKGDQTHHIEAVPGLFDALLKVGKLIDPLRDQRNSVAHSKRIEIDDLRTVEMYHIVLTDTEDPEILKRAFLFKQETDKKVWQYKAMLNKDTKNLKFQVYEVYNLLKDSFNIEYSRLTSS